MAEQRKKLSRWKVPWLNLFVVRGMDPRQLENRFDALEKEFKKQLQSGQGRNNRYWYCGRCNNDDPQLVQYRGRLLDKLNYLLGNVQVPLCTKCNEPKTPGGIQWIDHKECSAQGKTQDER